MVVPELPHWVQVAVLGVGLAMLAVSLALGIISSRKKPTKPEISVKMGNRNSIGQIGHDYDERQG